MDETLSYDCPSCGEPIDVWIDRSAGSRQETVEDCPVCCRPAVLSIRLDRAGEGHIEARSE